MNEEIIKKLQDAIASCSNIPGKEQYKSEITNTLLLLILQELGAAAHELENLVTAIYDLGEHLGR